jgi:hypothetical protein
MWSSWRNDYCREKQKYSQKILPSAILSTTNPILLDLGWKPGRRGRKPRTNFSNIHTSSFYHILIKFVAAENVEGDHKLLSVFPFIGRGNTDNNLKSLCSFRVWCLFRSEDGHIFLYKRLLNKNLSVQCGAVESLAYRYIVIYIFIY